MPTELRVNNKTNPPTPAEGAGHSGEGRFATIEIGSESLVRDSRGRFKENPPLLGEAAHLRTAIESVLGKTYDVDSEVFIALGQYGFDVRSRNAAQDDWVRRDHEVVGLLTSALRTLEMNAEADKPLSLARLKISTHVFAALRALAAIQALEAEALLRTSDGTVSHFPDVDSDVLAAARGVSDKDVAVNGPITGIDTNREGRLLIRIDYGSWIHVTKGVLQDLCEWLSNNKSIRGTAKDKDGTLKIDTFEVRDTQQQPGLPYGRRKHPRPVVPAEPVS
jgi:hypothetical protein